MTTTRVDAELIRSIPLFSKLSGEHIPVLAASASLRQFAARTDLFSEGDRLDNLYTVLHGAVELYSQDYDRSSTIAIVPAVSTFVLPSIFTEHTPLSARILEPSELIGVPVKLVVELLGRDAGFACAVMQQLAHECHELIEDFKSHRLRSTTERVAYWMLRCDGKSGSTGRIVIPFDKRVLASYLGMAPEHLSRSFSILASAGVVVRGRSVTLTDRTALSIAAGLIEPDQV
jgi:CRP/FNR family transcriptional regulator, transcriptional activator FtrB